MAGCVHCLLFHFLIFFNFFFCPLPVFSWKKSAERSSQPAWPWHSWHSWILAGTSTLSQQEGKALRLCRSSGSFCYISDVPKMWHLGLCSWGSTPRAVKARHSSELTSAPVPAATCCVLSPAELRLLTQFQLWHHL